MAEKDPVLNMIRKVTTELTPRNLLKERTVSSASYCRKEISLPYLDSEQVPQQGGS